MHNILNCNGKINKNKSLSNSISNNMTLFLIIKQFIKV